MQLFDTDILIDLLRGNPAAHACLEHSHADPAAISVVTKLELFRGCRTAGERRVVRDWLTHFQILHLTDDISRKAETIFERYHPRQGIGILDALIAGTAICNAAPLQTGNWKHFSGIADLDVRRYPNARALRRQSSKA